MVIEVSFPSAYGCVVHPVYAGSYDRVRCTCESIDFNLEPWSTRNVNPSDSFTRRKSVNTWVTS